MCPGSTTPLATSRRAASGAPARATCRKQFRELYEGALKDGRLPAIDTDFRTALLGGSGQPDLWNELVPATARTLSADKRRPAVFALARQCWQLEDQPLVQQLLTQVLAGVEDAKERSRLTLACVLAWHEFGQFADADRLLQGLLEEKAEARRPELWRLAAEIAESWQPRFQGAADAGAAGVGWVVTLTPRSRGAGRLRHRSMVGHARHALSRLLKRGRPTWSSRR